MVVAGEKITGGYSLIRTRGDNMWLMIKRKDGAADDTDLRRGSTTARDESVLTGRTMAQIEEQG